MSRHTLGRAYDPRANAITPMRLGLALLVVFSHSFVTGSFGYDPLYTHAGQRCSWAPWRSSGSSRCRGSCSPAVG